MYVVPVEYYFRIHHCRPRFKDDIENRLVFLTSELSYIPEMDEEQFAQKFNEAISRYGTNSTSTQKTIDNWRTEISSLFGFLEYGEQDIVKAGRVAQMLAERQDLVEFFKTFLFTFQYPGAHLSKQAILEQICYGVKFKPAQYIISVLNYAEKINNGNNRPYITKAEACHCIFNDLRCTRDNESPDKVWKRINDNRARNEEYDETGDVIRYAGDILDYMVNANLLTNHGNPRYYLNISHEKHTIKLFIDSKYWFNGYDDLYKQYRGVVFADMDRAQRREAYLPIDAQTPKWFEYVNQDLVGVDFRTKLSSIVTKGTVEYMVQMEKELEKFFLELQDKSSIKTKETGDFGEDRVYLYECKRVGKTRKDILHIINPIPTALAVGYDLQSVEADQKIKYMKRYIEVKTTIISTPINSKNIGFHLTPNEVSTAETVGEHYYVYRLIVNKTTGDAQLYIIKDPIKLFKEGLITMKDGNGANVSFNPQNRKVCSFEELKA